MFAALLKLINANIIRDLGLIADFGSFSPANCKSTVLKKWFEPSQSHKPLKEILGSSNHCRRLVDPLSVNECS